MVFTSLTFVLVFLPIMLLVYFTVPGRKWKNLALLLASLLFYAWGEPVYICLVLLSACINFTLARLIDRAKENNKKSQAKISFVLSLILNLGILGFFKYSGFMVENINYLFATDLQLKNLPLPVGISFYTFAAISYITDVYTEKIKAQKEFLLLTTYIALFPQIMAGPIVRYIHIGNELENRKESLADVVEGLKRFIIGLGKKILIANQMGIIADSIFNNTSGDPGTLLIWLGAIAYTFQIYFDFSGYSDMAIGLGRMLGFHYLENFNYPYISKSITEFWRRWHISLSSWFRDYVYIPLGGNRKWVLRNLFIVWFLTGLWHGASWNFVLWGLYYGFLLVLEKYVMKGLLTRMAPVMQHIYTMFFVVIGWVLFRIENLDYLSFYLERMFTYHKTSIDSLLFNYPDILHALPFLVIAFVASLPWFRDMVRKIESGSNQQLKHLYDLYLLAVLVVSLVFSMGQKFNPFIYFQF